MLGKLTWAAIPLDQPIPMIASGLVGLVIIGVLAWVTLKGWLPYLWREWITSVDHKRIGIMYILLAMVMLLRGFSDAIMMRLQQALAFRSPGYLPPEHYDQIFSAHGTLMIFFVAMPFVTAAALPSLTYSREHDIVASGDDHARLVLERRGSTLDEVEETFSGRLDMGAVLDVVGRPEAFSGRVVSLVEQGVECLKDERLVL